MKKLGLLFGVVFIFSAFILSGCEKSVDQGGLTISTSMSKSGITVNSGFLVFNSGFVIIKEVEFEGLLASGARVMFSEEKKTTINMFTGVATPALVMNIPAGTYNNVELEVEIFDENDKPSVVAEGVYTNDAGVSTPVRFEFNSGEVFEARSIAPVTLQQNTSATAKITFDPHVWFSTITKAQLNNAKRTNGVIIISETKNEHLFDIVADKLDDTTEAIFR